MKDKIIGFLALGIVILILVVSFMHYRNKALTAEKNALKNDLQRTEQTIKEFETVNELYVKVEKENERFREMLSNDNSDNLNVVVPTYILNELHKD